ncbi:MAG: MFS transporter [Actinobacteria bacterium]|nr:MFS transporter [Actinomycetota bacterium]
MRGLGRDSASAVAAATASSLAVFFVAALAVEIRGSLHFGASAFGLALSLYYVGAAAGSVPLGRLAEAVGGLRVMRGAALASGCVLAALGGLSHSWAALSGLLFLAGLISSAMQPASNLFLARRIDRSRQGTAFGIKQAAVPTAALLSGLAVPAIALTVGWRWAFAAAALLALGAYFVLPRPRLTLAAHREALSQSAPPKVGLPLLVLATGFFLGIFAATGMTAFLVTSAVASGLSKADAGLVAALAGAIAIATRVIVGIRADQRGRAHFPVVALMLLAGVAGYCALALASAKDWHWLFILGAAVAYGAGWGWNGLFNFAVVRTHRHAPARATSITQVGGRLAGVAGPLTFGIVEAHASFATAWSINAIAALVGSGIILLGRHLMIRAA